MKMLIVRTLDLGEEELTGVKKRMKTSDVDPRSGDTFKKNGSANVSYMEMDGMTPNFKVIGDGNLLWNTAF